MKVTNKIYGKGDIRYVDVYHYGRLIGTVKTDRGRSLKFAHPWNIDNNGYAYTIVDGKRTHIHKIVAGFAYTDHINRDRLDNRIRNLREVTPQQNSFNRSFNRYGVPSGIWPENNRWRVTLTRNKYVHKIGRFDNLLDAVLARQSAELKYFGDVVTDYSDFIRWLHDQDNHLT